MDGEITAQQLELSDAAADVLRPLSSKEADKRLESSRPVWRLGLDGKLLRANLLALWIWGAPTIDGRLVDSDFRGHTVFDIFARSVRDGRLPLELNRTFWIAKFRVESFLVGVHAGLEDIRTVHPILNDYYAVAKSRSLRDTDNWTYVLTMTAPSDETTLRDEVMRFRTTVSVVYDEAGRHIGFVADYAPVGYTRDIIWDTYQRLGVSQQEYVVDLTKPSLITTMTERNPNDQGRREPPDIAQAGSTNEQERKRATRRAFFAGFGSIIDMSGAALAPCPMTVEEALEAHDRRLAEDDRRLAEDDRRFANEDHHGGGTSATSDGPPWIRRQRPRG
jgi:hypothetical protein